MSPPLLGVLLMVVLAARVMLGVALWSPGWSALSEDDFGRVLTAQRWAQQPFLLTSPSMVWLPVQGWIHGSALRLLGHLFADNPMLLVALVNSAAVFGAAALVGRAAFVVFRSALGGLVAFVVVLFAPTSVLISLSGLSEPLYYLAVSMAVWGLVEWLRHDTRWALAAGSLGVAAAAGIRYDGWLLAASWAVIVPFSLATNGDQSPLTLLRLWRTRWPEVALAMVPLSVPALRLAAYAAHYGTVSGFLALQGQGFVTQFAGGTFASELSRWLFYPLPLLRSAPVLIPVLLGLAAWCTWNTPVVRPVVALLGLQFVVFCILSVSSGAMGGHRERYMFAYAIGLSPLLGVLPSLIGRLRRRAARIAVGGGLAVLAIGAMARGIAAPPDEWLPAADTLQLSSVLREAARSRPQPLRVVLGLSEDFERIILAVMNGRLLDVGRTIQPGVDVTGHVPAGVDVWIERVPARIAAIPVKAGRVVGRYHLYGPAAPAVPSPPNPLVGWGRRDETGTLTPLVPTRPLGLEFTSNDPRPGDTVALERTLPRAAAPQRGGIRVRGMYGHGFNPGRMTLDVRVDGRVLFSQDLADQSHWHPVTFTIPAGSGQSVVSVVLTASPTIESGWAWGRASTTLVDDLTKVQ